MLTQTEREVFDRTDELRCELVTDFLRLESLAPEWERLLKLASPGVGIFQSWGWTRAFWQTHRERLRLCAPVVYSGDDVVGILPLVLSGRKLQWLGSPYTDYNGPLCVPEIASEVLAIALTFLLRADVPWTECVFSNLPQDSPLLRYGGSYPAELGGHLQKVFQYQCVSSVEDGSGVFDRLTRKEDLRQRENRLRRGSQVEFRLIEDRSEIRKHLPEFFSQHVARLALMGLRSQFLTKDARALVEALVAELDPAGTLRFSVLEVDGRAVAYNLSFQQGGKFAFYIPAFDPDYWEKSPGAVLLRNLFKYSSQQGISEFDFTIGDEDYKNRFANRTTQTWSVHFYRSKWTPAVHVLRTWRRLRGAARSTPWITAWVRRATSALELPAACLSSPAAGSRRFAALCTKVFSVRREIYCRRARETQPPTDGHVRRAGLRDLAPACLKNEIGTSALQDSRRRLRQGDSLYLVSEAACKQFFWVRNDAAGTLTEVHGADFALQAIPGNAPALSALLAALPGTGMVRLQFPVLTKAGPVLESAGYSLHGSSTQILLFGRTVYATPRPPQSL